MPCTPLISCPASALRWVCARFGRMSSRDTAPDRKKEEMMMGASAVKAEQVQVENEKKEKSVNKRKSRSRKDFFAEEGTGVRRWMSCSCVHGQKQLRAATQLHLRFVGAALAKPCSGTHTRSRLFRMCNRTLSTISKTFECKYRHNFESCVNTRRQTCGVFQCIRIPGRSPSTGGVRNWGKA